MRVKTLLELGRRCKRGQVLRKGYTTKRGVRVRPSCVKDTGAPGKTPKSKKWAKFRSPYLPGWSKDLPEGARKDALSRLARRESCKDVLARLNQLANVTADMPTEATARADRKWLRDQDWCYLKSKGRGR